ncbi:MAG: acetyl-CoA carboxylase biotin carboxyl carrier protein [Opitutaceae bacterium]
MDLKQIKQIIDLMKRSDLSEFAVEEQGFKLKIRRGMGGYPVVSSSAPPPPVYPPRETGGTPAPSANLAGPGDETEEPGIAYVKSPMVGTFYRSASPDSKAFVEPDGQILENTVVCIIEAMKIMNEIQAEVKGTILEALVENGQPVEYGQRLFKVKQS